MAANIERVVSIIFDGVDKVSGVTKDVTDGLGRMADGVRDVTGPMASLANGILAADAALNALIAGGAAYATKAFADFEDVMLSVRGIMQASPDDYKRLTDLVKDLGASTRYTASEAAEGLKFLAMAGLDVDESIGSLPNVLALAQAAAIDLGTAADITTNIMTGYGAEVSDLAHINDVLTATFTSSNTNLMELGQAFKFAGPIASALGLDIEEVAAVLGKFADAGYKADMAGTALRNIMLALLSPAGNVGKLMDDLGVNADEVGINVTSSAAALKSLGVEVKGTDGNIRPLTDILGDLKAGLERIPDPADRTALVMEMFGKRGGPQLQALLEMGGESVKTLEEKIRSLGGVTQDIANEMESGMGGAIRLIRSATESVVLEIGEQLARGAAPASEGLAELIRAIGKEVSGGSFEPIFEAFERFGQEAAQTFRDIAAAMPEAFDKVDWSRLISAYEGLGKSVRDAFEAVFGEVDLATPEGLAKAIQRVADGITILTNATSGIIDGMKPFLHVLGTAVDSIENMDDSTVKLVGEVLGFAKGLNTVAGIISNMTPIMGAFAGVLTLNVLSSLTTLAAAFPAVTGAVGAFASAISAIAIPAGLMAAAAAGGYALGKALDETYPIVGKVADAVVDAADAVLHFSEVQGPTAEEIDFVNRKYEEAKARHEAFEKSQAAATEEVHQMVVELALLGDKIKEVPKETDVKVEVDESSFGETRDFIEYVKEGVTIREYFELDRTSLEKSEDEIEKKLPAEKQMEIEAELDVEKIKAASDIVQSAIEWEAKLEIAEVEANAEKVVSIMEGVTANITTAGEVLNTIFGSLDQLSESGFWKYDIMRWIDAEIEIQKEAVDIQRDIANAEISLMEARRKRYESGEALITVAGDGLAPHLEAMMFSVLEAVQVQGNMDAEDYLLGSGA